MSVSMSKIGLHRVFEVAIVNAFCQGRIRCLAHLETIQHQRADDHSRIEADLERDSSENEDENVVDKLLGTLKDSVSLVGSFDSVRTKGA